MAFVTMSTVVLCGLRPTECRCDAVCFLCLRGETQIMKKSTILTVGIAVVLVGGSLVQADLVTSFSANFDDRFSGDEVVPSAQGLRVDDTQEQVGWASSPGYYNATELYAGGGIPPFSAILIPDITSQRAANIYDL